MDVTNELVEFYGQSFHISPVHFIARKPSLERSRKVKQQKPQLMLEDLAALEDLQSLVDNLLDAEENEEEEDFLIFLRLSPIPKYLVKGYDFKMLNKYINLRYQ